MAQSLFARANGINIHYLREGHGPPLVLLHGWPEFCHVWQPVIAALRDRFELFAPDLRLGRTILATPALALKRG